MVTTGHFKEQRLTAEQRERLAATVSEGSRGERATEREARVLARVATFVRVHAPDVAACRAAGTQPENEKRHTLRRACALFGVRQPPMWCEQMDEWLRTYKTRRGPISPNNRARTMWAIDCMAVGLGYHYSSWPSGVGVLLNGAPGGESGAPRLLTMRSDPELLRLEGKRLEAAFGTDAGNGWGFNHPLNKFFTYQTALLAKHFDGECPAAPPLRDLE